MSKPWFRFHRKAINNRKVRCLSPELFQAWVLALCCCDDNGVLNDIADVAFEMRVSEDKAQNLVDGLISGGMFDVDGNGSVTARDWLEHNPASDGVDPTAAERNKRYRDRRKQERNVTITPLRVTPVTVTALDTDTDTDTDTEESRGEARFKKNETLPNSKPNPVSKSEKPKVQRGTRWPADAVVPDDWIDAVADKGRSLVDLRLEAEKFANYWASRAGGGAIKLDWRRTWINWILQAKGSQNGGFNGKLEQGGSLIDAAKRVAIRHAEAAEQRGGGDGGGPDFGDVGGQFWRSPTNG